MGAVVYSLKWLGLSLMVTLIIQVCVGVIIYIAMAWIFKLECFNYLVSTMKDIFNSNKEHSCNA
jgi:teichuronic acid exporter